MDDNKKKLNRRAKLIKFLVALLIVGLLAAWGIFDPQVGKSMLWILFIAVGAYAISLSESGHGH